MALNLFGFFEFATSSLSLASYDRYSGFLGNFLSGALTVVVATPVLLPSWVVLWGMLLAHQIRN